MEPELRFQCLARLPLIPTAFRQIDCRLRGDRSRHFPFVNSCSLQFLKLLADVPRELGHLQIVLLGHIGAASGVQLERSAVAEPRPAVVTARGHRWRGLP